jgi:large subunit ribosomal protein L31
MKPDIHPDYHDVIFVDSATGTEWTSRSTVTSKETREIEGVEVPVVRLEISAVSHPFWTGTQRELDADGKIDRFRKRYGGVKAGSATAPEEPPAEAEASEEVGEAPAAGDTADDTADDAASEETPSDDPAPSESA